MLHAERALYALKIFLPFSPSALSLSTGRIWASPLRAKRRKPIEPDTDGSSSTSSSDNTMHFVRWPGRRPGFKICPNHDGGCPVVRQLSGSSGCFYYILCVDFLPNPSEAPGSAASCCSVSAVSHGWCVGQGVWMVFRRDAATYPRQSNSADSAWCMVAAYRSCIRKCNPFHWSFLHEGCRKRCTKGSANRVQKWLCIPVHQSTPTGVRHSHCYLLGHFKCHFTETQPCTGSPHIQPVPVSPRSSWYILR